MKNRFIKTFAILFSAVIVLSSLAACGKKDAGEVTITLAAAASLKNAFENDLIPKFNERYPNIRVSATYDSSGKLQTQIEEGLDADIFFSAAMKQMNALDEKGMIESSTINKLLENKIVLVVGTDSAHIKDGADAWSDFTDITKAEMIAIGDPESVPAGQYAKEAFTSLGIWDEVSAKASLGTNVTEVLSWVAAGSAEAGVVYATDAASEPKVSVITAAPEDSLEKPVIYPVARLKNSKHQDAANAFLDFLAGSDAKAIFEKYGFTVK